jgi:hypothetical protein
VVYEMKIKSGSSSCLFTSVVGGSFESFSIFGFAESQEIGL